MTSLLHALRAVYSDERLLQGSVELVKLVLGAFLIYLVLGRIVQAAVRAASRRLPEAAHRQRVTTLLLLLGSLARYVFIFVVGYWVLKSLFGFDMVPVLASVLPPTFLPYRGSGLSRACARGRRARHCRGGGTDEPAGGVPERSPPRPGRAGLAGDG